MTDEPKRTSIDWSAIADDVTKRGHELLDEYSAKAKQTASLAGNGEYRADALLDDIADFWKGVASLVEEAVDSWRTHVVHRDDAS